MNRRGFFKAVTGFFAGVFATSVEGKKNSLTISKRLGCKDCFKECVHFDACLAELKAANPLYTLYYVDDSKMIQEAINLAKDGGIVYFPKGIYNIKSTIIA